MNKTVETALAAFLLVCITSSATGQWNVARFDADPNRLYTAVGLDPAVVPTLGYARLVPVFGHTIQLSADVGIPVRPDTRDYRATLQALASIIHWHAVHLNGSVSFITRGTENSIYRGFNFGADVTGTLGVYRPGWFVAGEFGFDKAIITHVTHSEWYRTYFFADARDGWYLDTGGTFHYGAVGGVTLGRVELSARYGALRTQGFNALVPPMYGSLGVGFGF